MKNINQVLLSSTYNLILEKFINDYEKYTYEVDRLSCHVKNGNEEFFEATVTNKSSKERVKIFYTHIFRMISTTSSKDFSGWINTINEQSRAINKDFTTNYFNIIKK